MHMRPVVDSGTGDTVVQLDDTQHARSVFESRSQRTRQVDGPAWCRQARRSEHPVDMLMNLSLHPCAIPVYSYRVEPVSGEVLHPGILKSEQVRGARSEINSCCPGT